MTDTRAQLVEAVVRRAQLWAEALDDAPELMQRVAHNALLKAVRALDAYDAAAKESKP